MSALKRLRWGFTVLATLSAVLGVVTVNQLALLICWLFALIALVSHVGILVLQAIEGVRRDSYEIRCGGLTIVSREGLDRREVLKTVERAMRERGSS